MEATATAPAQTTATTTAAEYSTEKVGVQTLKGNVVRDAKLITEGNSPYLKVDVAINQKDSEGIDLPTRYVECHVYNTTLEPVITKGILVEVTGNLFRKTRVSDDKVFENMNVFKTAFC